MKPTVALVKSMTSQPDWFTPTQVLVRVTPNLGGYLLELDGDFLEALESLEREEQLGEVVSVSAVIHDPARDWIVAFRVDQSGIHIAANAPPAARETADSRIREVVKSA